MKCSKWIVFALALAMLPATAGLIWRAQHGRTLGTPGVKVGTVPLYGADNKQIADHSVLLPENVSGTTSKPLPITEQELTGLPQDTTFGRRLYTWPDNFQAMLSVVLMGEDRSSIHQPQFCLVAQGWSIDQTEPVKLHVERPFAYEFEAKKLTTSILAKNQLGQPQPYRGVYIYWFVAKDKLTAEQGTRMWSIGKTLLETGVLERWAYVTCFATCLPGQEEITTERLKTFITQSVPEFQLATGPRQQVATAKTSH